MRPGPSGQSIFVSLIPPPSPLAARSQLTFQIRCGCHSHSDSHSQCRCCFFVRFSRCKRKRVWKLGQWHSMHGICCCMCAKRCLCIRVCVLLWVSGLPLALSFFFALLSLCAAAFVVNNDSDFLTRLASAWLRVASTCLSSAWLGLVWLDLPLACRQLTAYFSSLAEAGSGLAPTLFSVGHADVPHLRQVASNGRQGCHPSLISNAFRSHDLHSICISFQFCRRHTSRIRDSPIHILKKILVDVFCGF